MLEFLFKYPRQAFADSSFVLASGWPLWLLYALGVACALAVAAALYMKRASMKWWQLLILGVLQTAMLALVLFVVWQPALVNERLLKGENAVAVMLDTSASMAVADGDSTRIAQAKALLKPGNLKQLSDNYKLLPYAFADQAHAIPSFDDANLPPPGNSTVLGQSILQALRGAGSASLGAVVVVSDGADNNGAISQQELGEIAGFGVPVHTIGIGRETMPEDLELESVQLPTKALPGSTLTARLTIRHDAGGTARIKVYKGDTFLSAHEVPLDAAQKTTQAFVNIEVPDPGQLDLRFVLDPINGERDLANNTQSRVVDVPEGKYRILYMEGEPRWEYKFMQRALGEDPSIQLSTYLKVTPNKYYRQGISDPKELEKGFPTDKKDLYLYDALILGSVNVAEFTPEQQELIRDFVSVRGGTLMMIGGLHGLGLGGWSESVVNDVLPARLSQQDNAFTRTQVPVVLTASGRTSPVLKFSDNDADNVKQWSDIPPVADYQVMGPLRPAATTLLEVVTEDNKHLPLLVTQPYGRGHSVILATGGTWRWQMNLPVEDQRHETFWRQLARDLVSNAPRPFEVSATADGQNIHVRAEIRDADSKENQGVAVTAVASSPNGELVNMEMLPVAGKSGVFEAAFTPKGAGLYSIEAISRKGDKVVNSVRSATRFEQNAEAFNIRQNRALLERLSQATHGQYWTPAEWSKMVDAISYSTAGITEQQISYLWDAPFFFLMLVLLKSIEWLLRRQWRVI
ncbi:MAG TPA: glutamine amidotransferase [Candidatus Acidoferrum sp.]|nr:glutamine amidotransferase [Candidatus Acidoferrum sp.]